MSISIRVATFEDTQIVAELAIQMWESNTVEELTQEICEYISKENGTIFLAMVDGCAVGFAQCGLSNAIQLSIISVVFCHREPLFFMPKNFKNITKNS